MSAALHDAIAALLVNDTTFAGAITALIGQSVPRVLNTNTPVEQIPHEQVPCWVMDAGDGQAGDGDGYGGVLGNHEQTFTRDVEIGLVWFGEDREQAADARRQVPDLLAQLFLRNATAGGAQSIWLESWTNDRGALHPTHVIACTVRAVTVTQRS